MCLNKQDSEYTLDHKYAKILNMAKFWISQTSQYFSVTQRFENAWICLDRVLNISWILNIPGFWIWQDSEHASVTQDSKYATMVEDVWIGREYAWIFDNWQGSESEYVWYNI